MRITGTPEEFAALALALQERREEKYEKAPEQEDADLVETLPDGTKFIPWESLTLEQQCNRILRGEPVCFFPPYSGKKPQGSDEKHAESRE